MHGTVSRALGVVVATLALATAAQAQGHGDDHDQGHGNTARNGTAATTQRSIYGSNRTVNGSTRSVYGSNGDVVRSGDRDGDHDADRDGHGRYGTDGQYQVPGNGVRVPPGLAKKPGQMPPGQYRKYYSTAQGAGVLGDILRQRGYRVDRIVAAGPSRYVYYRTRYGEQRAIVSPGTNQLLFRNVPQSLLQEVLSRLY